MMSVIRLAAISEGWPQWDFRFASWYLTDLGGSDLLAAVLLHWWEYCASCVCDPSWYERYMPIIAQWDIIKGTRLLGCYWRTSVWCLRSSSMRSVVSFRSTAVSTLEAIVLILIFCRLAEKPTLNENESVELTSRPGGCFLRILYFAHAKDWRLRCSSPSGIPVASLISYPTTSVIIDRCQAMTRAPDTLKIRHREDPQIGEEW